MITELPDNLEPVSTAWKKVTRKEASKTTLWRHCTVGLHGIKLKVIYVGASAQTTEEWVTDFILAVTAKKEAKHATSNVIATPKKRAQRVASSKSDLAKTN